MGSAHWQPKRLLAVAIAVIGVFFIVYGGTARGPNTSEGKSKSTQLLGDTLTLLASVVYALYQTTYKRYVALPIGGVMVLKILDYILDCGQMAAIFLCKSFI
jgi:drug/metabolite transporter (DMT)-like permease